MMWLCASPSYPMQDVEPQQQRSLNCRMFWLAYNPLSNAVKLATRPFRNSSQPVRLGSLFLSIFIVSNGSALHSTDTGHLQLCLPWILAIVALCSYPSTKAPVCSSTSKTWLSELAVVAITSSACELETTTIILRRCALSVLYDVDSVVHCDCSPGISPPIHRSSIDTTSRACSCLSVFRNEDASASESRNRNVCLHRK